MSEAGVHPLEQCKVCGLPTEKVFDTTILGKYQVACHRCAHCGFVFLPQPFWLEEAYSDAIAVTDTGLVQRNISISLKLATILQLWFDPRACYADAAGGYGLLVRLMRDMGFNFFWQDEYCKNIHAQGFAVDAVGERAFAAVTAFEVLEHVADPLSFLRGLMTKYRCRTLVLSTETYVGDKAPAEDWHYYSQKTGQHISFYQVETLQFLAKQLGLKHSQVMGLHILSEQQIRCGRIGGRLLRSLSSFFANQARRRLGSLTQADSDRLMSRL